MVKKWSEGEGSERVSLLRSDAAFLAPVCRYDSKLSFDSPSWKTVYPPVKVKLWGPYWLIRTGFLGLTLLVV